MQPEKEPLTYDSLARGTEDRAPKRALENFSEKLCGTADEKAATTKKARVAQEMLKKAEEQVQRAQRVLDEARDEQDDAIRNHESARDSALNAAQDEIERLKQGSELPEKLAKALKVIAGILNALKNHDPLEQFAYGTDDWNILRRAQEFCIDQDHSANGDEDVDDHVGGFLALIKTIAELVIWTELLSKHTGVPDRRGVFLDTSTGRFYLLLAGLSIEYLPSVLTAFLYSVVDLDHNSGFETSSLHGLSADELSLRACGIEKFAARDTRIEKLNISSNRGFTNFTASIEGLKEVTFQLFVEQLRELVLDQKELWESIRSGVGLSSDCKYTVLHGRTSEQPGPKPCKVPPPSEQGSAPTNTECGE